MKPISNAMKKYIKLLKKLPRSELALPYASEINWELDPNWKKYDQIGGEVPVEDEFYRGKPIVGKPAPGSELPTTKTSKSRSLSMEKRQTKKSNKSAVEKPKKRKSEKNKSSKTKAKPKSKKDKKSKKSKKDKKDKKIKKIEKDNRKSGSVSAHVLDSKSSALTIPKALEQELRAVYKEVIRKSRLQSTDRVLQLAASFEDEGMHNSLLDELTALAYVLINSRQFSDAIVIFEYIDSAINKISKSRVKLNQNPVSANSAILIGLGTALAQSNKLMDATKAFTRVIKLRKSAKGKLTSRQMQDMVDVYARRGEVYSALGNSDAALEDFDNAITMLEDNNLSPNAYAHLYQSRGVIWYKKAVYTKALPDIQKSDQLAPNDAKTWVWMGKVLKEFADTQGCLEALDKSLQLQPSGNKEAIMEKAIALLEVSRWEEAVAFIDQVLAIDPHHKLVS